MIRDLTRNPSPDKDFPNYRRRRSTSLCPISTWSIDTANAAFEARRKSTRKNRLANIAVIPRPVKRSLLRPSLKRFMSGRSSLWSVAKALHDRHQRQRGLRARLSQSLLWAGLDQKELVAELNEQSRNSPELPKSLSVRLRVCRSALVALMNDMGMRGFRYSDFEDVLIFFKVAEISKKRKKGRSKDYRSDRMQVGEIADQEEKVTESLVNKVSLSSASVILFVGANKPPGGVPNSDGLGQLYMSTGRVVSGDSALALRVLDSLGKRQ